jgi:uncharacterized SAM-binding protein YcdF (DUF218 family)
MKKVFFYILIFLILIVFGIINYYPFLLTTYAEFFTVNNATKGADAIVVLSGNIETRFPRAVQLFKEGYAQQILLTESRLRNTRFKNILMDEKAIARAIMDALRVKVPVVVVSSLKGGATSTFDEAYDLRSYGQENRFKHLIIVTDNNHTRRALYAFKKIFKGTGIRLEAMGAKNNIFNEANWWQSDYGISAYITEGIKYTVYLLSNQNISFIRNY